MRLEFPCDGTPRVVLIRRKKEGASLPNLVVYRRIKNYHEVLNFLRLSKTGLPNNFPIILESKMSSAKRAVKFKNTAIKTIGKIHALIYQMGTKLQKIIWHRNNFLSCIHYGSRRVAEILTDPHLAYITKEFYIDFANTNYHTENTCRCFDKCQECY